MSVCLSVLRRIEAPPTSGPEPYDRQTRDTVGVISRPKTLSFEISTALGRIEMIIAEKENKREEEQK